MRVSAWLLTLLATVPSVAAAQSTTADGVRALVEGDYATAARILRPLADETATPDPVAQFFLATLYQGGFGVRADPVRACGLFLKSATSQNPFRDEARQIADWFRDQGRLSQLCEGAAANPWGAPAPVTFTLAADHWVSIEAERVTVGYQGAQKIAAMTMGGPGWVYLPTRHTRIETSRSTEVRHFIEFFVWIPRSSRYDPLIANNAAWTLQWMLCEVVGMEFVALAAGAPLATSEGDQPSIRPEVHDLARIRMNAAGEVEWIAQGAFPSRGVLAGARSR